MNDHQDIFVFKPQDTLFFRDGRPFEQADDGLAAAASLFPPLPSTLGGALRAALALGMGWDGSSPWGADVIRALGDGPDLTGCPLQLGAPFLMRQEKGTWQRLFPAPRCLQVYKGEGAKKENKFQCLHVGPTPILTDLGHLHPLSLPRPPSDAKSVRPATDYWLTDTALAEILRGQYSADDTNRPVHQDELWQREHRIGLTLTVQDRSADPGKLYAASHIRLRDTVVLAQPASGGPSGGTLPMVISCGGEHRFASVEKLDRKAAQKLKIPRRQSFTRQNGCHLVCVILLSPRVMPTGWDRPGPVRGEDGIEILAAALGDPVAVGGWDSRKGHTGPRPLRAMVPTGSCWYLRVTDTALKRLDTVLGPENNPDAAHGFGQYTLGTYSLSK
ncbi:type III-B CRISPR module-associated Cmr3 family protein [Insolitispirillum peregrinum]|uniref:type III-B CRISPR module-associated Cmr3 family protein n=1 Tax=Insolitispirillum peregrinum TaxID=80876 RepID=UPI003619F41E